MHAVHHGRGLVGPASCFDPENTPGQVEGIGAGRAESVAIVGSFIRDVRRARHRGCVFWKRESSEAVNGSGESSSIAIQPDNNISVGLCIFDTTPDGAGLVNAAYDVLGKIWDRALATIRNCKCTSWCPSCVRVGRWHTEVDNRYARVALEGITGAWMR